MGVADSPAVGSGGVVAAFVGSGVGANEVSSAFGASTASSGLASVGGSADSVVLASLGGSCPAVSSCESVCALPAIRLKVCAAADDRGGLAGGEVCVPLVLDIAEPCFDLQLEQPASAGAPAEMSSALGAGGCACVSVLVGDEEVAVRGEVGVEVAAGPGVVAVGAVAAAVAPTAAVLPEEAELCEVGADDSCVAGPLSTVKPLAATGAVGFASLSEWMPFLATEAQLHLGVGFGSAGRGPLSGDAVAASADALLATKGSGVLLADALGGTTAAVEVEEAPASGGVPA